MNERIKRALCALLTAAVLFGATGFLLSPEGSRRGIDMERRAALPEGTQLTLPSPSPAPDASEASDYAGNKISRVFHRPGCSSLSHTAEKNRVPFAARQDALDAGYTPCQRCNP